MHKMTRTLGARVLVHSTITHTHTQLPTPKPPDSLKITHTDSQHARTPQASHRMHNIDPGYMMVNFICIFVCAMLACKLTRCDLRVCVFLARFAMLLVVRVLRVCVHFSSGFYAEALCLQKTFRISCCAALYTDYTQSEPVAA